VKGVCPRGTERAESPSVVESFDSRASGVGKRMKMRTT
jgi:hypothetical protein